MIDTLFTLPAPSEPSRPPERAAPRLQRPNRLQVELRPTDLEGLLPEDHTARIVWAFVTGVDLSPLYEGVRAVEGRAGRPPIDPAVLLALWLYATLEGVGSARAVAQLCEAHDAYRWICGGVSVNHHTLSDFRVAHPAFLDGLLTTSVATLLDAGLVKMQRVAQDGMRVRAAAGAASFRRRDRLARLLAEAQAQVTTLKAELDADPAATRRRLSAARARAAQSRAQRIAQALKRLPEVEAKKKPTGSGSARVSTTDPEAQVMKMADGGFRPAYNVQLATDTASQIIVGVDLDNSGSDKGRLTPMVCQWKWRYGRTPAELLADGGFLQRADLQSVSLTHSCTVYLPVPKPKDPDRPPHAPREGDDATLAAWRIRMGTAAAQAIYQQRASTAECVNALARNRGFQQFRVRGSFKALMVSLWYAIAHNVMRGHALRLATVPG